MNIQNTISLNDKLSPVMLRVLKSLDTVISTMEKVDRATNNAELGSTFSKASSEIRSAISAVQALDTQIKNMSDSSKDVGKNLTKWSNPIVTFDSALNLARRGLDGIKALTSGGMSFIDEFNKDVEARQRLATIGGARGITSQQQSDILDSASQTQQSTTFSASALTAGLSELASYNLPAEQLQQMLPTLADFAAGQKGINVDSREMVQLAMQLGRAIDGNTAGLSSMGFTFDDAQKKILKTGTAAERTATIIEVIGDSYSGLAEAMAQTPEGKFAQMKNDAADLKVELAGYLMPAYMGFTTAIRSSMPAIGEIANKAFSVIGSSLNSFLGYLPSILGFVDTVIGAFSSIKDTVLDNASSFEGLGSAIITPFKEVLPQILSISVGIINTIIEIAGGFAQILGPAISGVASIAVPLLVFGLSMVGETLGVISGIVNGSSVAFQALRSIIIGVGAVMLATATISRVQAVATAVQTAATNAATIAQKGLNTALKANPIGFVIGLVIALITYMMQLWETNVNFRVGVLKVWNTIATAFENMIIGMSFLVIEYIKLTDKVKLALVQGFETAINMIIGKINSLTGLLDKIGITVPKIEEVAWSASLEQDQLSKQATLQAGLDAISESFAQNQADRQRAIDEEPGKFAAKQATVQTPVIDTMDKVIPDDFVFKTLSTGGKLDSIEDPLTLNKEDVKVLTDLANLKYNLEYKQVTPQITVTFGDVRETVDIDEVVVQLNQQLKEVVDSAL